MYSKKVLNIFSNPANAGRIMKPDGIASLSNMEETANVEFSLRIPKANKVLLITLISGPEPVKPKFGFNSFCNKA